MKKSRIEKIHPVGPDHVVVTAVAPASESKSLYRRKPCSDCPWRKDAKIGEFPVEAYRHSARTAYDVSQHTFACHQSGTDKPAMCAGFLLRGADHNMSVRMGFLMGRIQNDTEDGGLELYENYREMAIANGVDPDDEVLAACRD